MTCCHDAVIVKAASITVTPPENNFWGAGADWPHGSLRRHRFHYHLAKGVAERSFPPRSESEMTGA